VEIVDKVIEYAPILIVVLVFLIQQRIIVTPEQLEKKHREILEDADKKYVSLPAYKVFCEQVVSDINEVKAGVNEIKEYLMTRRKGDL
jgi:hypothetical protein